MKGKTFGDREMSRLRRAGIKKTHLQVTSPEGTSGMQNAHLKVEIQELRKAENLENTSAEET